MKAKKRMLEDIKDDVRAYVSTRTSLKDKERKKSDKMMKITVYLKGKEDV